MKNVLSEFNLKLKDASICAKSIVFYEEDGNKFVDIEFVNNYRCGVLDFEYEVLCKNADKEELFTIPGAVSEEIASTEQASLVTMKLPKETEYGVITLKGVTMEGDIKAVAAGCYHFTSDENISLIVKEKYQKGEALKDSTSQEKSNNLTVKEELQQIFGKKSPKQEKAVFSVFSFVAALVVLSFLLVVKILCDNKPTEGSVIVQLLLSSYGFTLAIVWDIIALVKFIKSACKRGMEPTEKKKLVYIKLIEFLLSLTMLALSMYYLFKCAEIFSMYEGTYSIYDEWEIILNVYNALLGIATFASIIVQICFIAKVAGLKCETSKDKLINIFLWIVSMLVQGWLFFLFLENTITINKGDKDIAFIFRLVSIFACLAAGGLSIVCLILFGKSSKNKVYIRHAVFAIVIALFLLINSAVAIPSIGDNNIYHYENGVFVPDNPSKGGSSKKTPTKEKKSYTTSMNVGQTLEADPGYDFSYKYIKLNISKNQSYKLQVRQKYSGNMTVKICDEYGELIDTLYYYSGSTCDFNFKVSYDSCLIFIESDYDVTSIYLTK